MSKYWFSEFNEDECGTIEFHKKYMHENLILEMDIFEAEAKSGTGYFFCSKLEEIGLTNEGCGKQCQHYEPRNKKNGRCRFSGSVYVKGEKKKKLKIPPIQLELDI